MGGDLNLKKSWHPNTIKNQKRVWRAEQENAAEKQKFLELQQEITAERNRDDLIRIGQSSGVLGSGIGASHNNDSTNKKLEWMYKGSTDLLNREEYLLGRSIDKNFEQHILSEKEQQQQLVGVTIPKNHVEHECIPFSIRSYRGTQSEDQVDLQRKIMEDPLMSIKQREIETRKKILENPVKLKELHRLLRNEESVNTSTKKKKKKSNKRKSEKKKAKHSNSDNDSDFERNLDVVLAMKYKKIQSDINRKSTKFGTGESDINSLLHKKYDSINKNLDKISKYKNKSKRHNVKSAAKNDRKSSYNNSDDEVSVGSNKPSYGKKSRIDIEAYKKPASSNMQMQSNDKYRDSEYKYEKIKRRTISSSSSSPSASHSDNDKITTKNYGLVSADGKKLDIKNKYNKKIPSTYTNRKPTIVTHSITTNREKLTEEQKSERLKEMMTNAEWRNSEREKTVSKYREEQIRNETSEQYSKRNFDKNFVNKEMHKALSSQTSVESRIKSNINNIQRSGFAMDTNFAKR